MKSSLLIIKPVGPRFDDP